MIGRVSTNLEQAVYLLFWRQQQHLTGVYTSLDFILQSIRGQDNITDVSKLFLCARNTNIVGKVSRS